MNTTIDIDGRNFYCCAIEDKKGGTFTAKWVDLLDGGEGYSNNHRSESEAMKAAKNGANHMNGFKYKQRREPEMEALKELIHGKKNNVN
jgi:hypothetical protein